MDHTEIYKFSELKAGDIFEDENLIFITYAGEKTHHFSGGMTA